MKFSILVVSLNPQDELKKTLKSIEEQSFKDYEVIVKDGGSTDQSLLCLKEFEGKMNLRLEISKDKGIYDGMNQAVLLARGDYVYFLNCGDYFSTPYVLENIASRIENAKSHSENSGNRYIFYGNIFERLTNNVVSSNPRMDAFGCYRHVPCHQACFYDRTLVAEHPFDTDYKVRADYEQFLWCFFEAKAEPVYTGILIADYEGGGFSEQNQKISNKEHKVITSKYMTKKELFKYKTIMIITLAPLRTAIAKNPKTAKVYNFIKKNLYKVRMK